MWQVAQTCASGAWATEDDSSQEDNILVAYLTTQQPEP